MLYDKDYLLNEINNLENGTFQNVKCFVDNEFLEFNNIIDSKNLKKSFENLDFIFDGGQSLREFYIIINNVNYTIQILENEIEVVESLSF